MVRLVVKSTGMTVYLTSAKLEGKSTIRAPPKRGVDVKWCSAMFF